MKLIYKDKFDVSSMSLGLSQRHTRQRKKLLREEEKIVYQVGKDDTCATGLSDSRYRNLSTSEESIL